MEFFYKETDHIYRLCVPFDDLYTSVFLIKTEDGYILVDSATTDRDVDEWIIPAILKLGVRLPEVKKILITHNHGDHAGGLLRLLTHLPHAEVVRDARELYSLVRIYPLAGHTEDFIGVLDLRTNTLISGDGLQGAGVGKYRCSLENKEAYRNTLEKIRRDGFVENLLFSHEYEPWYENGIFGREKVLLALLECEKYL